MSSQGHEMASMYVVITLSSQGPDVASMYATTTLFIEPGLWWITELRTGNIAREKKKAKTQNKTIQKTFLSEIVLSEYIITAAGEETKRRNWSKVKEKPSFGYKYIIFIFL